MVLKVDNKDLINNLTKHLSGKSKCSVNFTIEKDFIKLQSSNEFILDTILQGTYEDKFIGGSFTVVINNSIELLRSDKGSHTIINFMGDRVFFDQGDIVIPFSVAYDSRIDVKFSNLQDCGSVSTDVLSSVNRRSKNMINLSKSLDVGASSIVIVHGRSFHLYSNCMVVAKVPDNLPDIEIPYLTFNNLARNLYGSKVNVKQDNNLRVILLECSDSSYIQVNYKKPNEELIKSIDSKINELAYCGNFNVSNLNRFEVVYKCFPKETICLNFYKDGTVGALLSLTDGKTASVGTKDEQAELRMFISTAQFDTLLKLLNGRDIISVYKGKDVIYVKISDDVGVLMSGMTF